MKCATEMFVMVKTLTRRKEMYLKRMTVLAGIVALSASPCFGAMITDSMMFAYDFENVTGNTVKDISGQGNDGTKTANVSTDTVDPISPFSAQHIQAPTSTSISSGPYASVDSNYKLTANAPQLSFSMFINMRGIGRKADFSHATNRTSRARARTVDATGALGLRYSGGSRAVPCEVLPA